MSDVASELGALAGNVYNDVWNAPPSDIGATDFSIAMQAGANLLAGTPGGEAIAAASALAQFAVGVASGTEPDANAEQTLTNLGANMLAFTAADAANTALLAMLAEGAATAAFPALTAAAGAALVGLIAVSAYKEAEKALSNDNAAGGMLNALGNLGNDVSQALGDDMALLNAAGSGLLMLLQRAAGLFGQAMTDPLVIDLAGTGLNLTAVSASSPQFVWNGQTAQQTGWVGTGTGFLVLNNGSSSITAANMFGPGAPNGFAALATLDANHDGVIDASDPGFAQLAIWEPPAGATSGGQLLSLTQLGIKSISLVASPNSGMINGNSVDETAIVAMDDGSTREIADVNFAVNAGVTVNPGGSGTGAAAALPEVPGFGTLTDLRTAMSQDSTLLELVQNLLSLPESSQGAFDAALQSVLYEWAGVSSVDPTSRGALFDAQKLSFLEKALGTSFYAWGATNPTYPDQGVVLERAYETLFNGIKARILIQDPNSVFSSYFSVDPATGQISVTQNLGYVIAKIGANAPAGPAAAVSYWSDALLILNEVAPEYTSLSPDVQSLITKILRNAAPADLSSDMLSAAASGSLTYVDAGPTGAQTAGSLAIVTANGPSLVSIAESNATITASGGTNEFIVSAGAGNDLITGIGLNDFILLETGAGNVTVDEYNSAGPSGAILWFDTGATAANVDVSSNGTDFILTNASTGETVTLRNEMATSQAGVAQITFADGTSLTRQQLLTLALTGSPTNTKLYGSSNAEVFDGKGYATYAQGGGGTDTFIYNSGYGALEINEDGGWQEPSTAILQFGTGIAASQIRVTGDSAGNLYLTDGVSGDRIKLDGERNLAILGAPEYGVAQVTFADGTSWSRAQLLQQALIASPTNQTLYGTGGADTFVYHSGDGAVEVVENTGNTNTASSAVLQLAAGIIPSQVSAHFDLKGNEIIIDSITGDGIQLDGEQENSYQGVDQLAFADGTTLNRQQILALVPAATQIYGTSGADIIDGGGHATYEKGNGGSDVFVYRNGYGPQEISEDGGYGVNSTAVLDLIGVHLADLMVTSDGGQNYILTDATPGDRIVLDAQMGGGYAGATSEFGVASVIVDGTTLSRQDLITLEETAVPGKANIYGTAAAETFDPKGYARYLQGNGGADVFIYNMGYGALEVKGDGGVGVNSTSSLQFGPGITASQLQVTSDGSSNLTITDGTTGDKLVLDGEMGGGYGGATAEYGVVSANFADGSSLTRQQLITLEETATPGKNNIYGTSAAEIFDPKGYARYLQGDGGADTYIYNSGYGAVEINADGGYGVNSISTLQFGPGITASQLQVTNDGSSNLTITDGTTGDKLVLDGEMGGGYAGATAEYGVVSANFADGSSLTRQQLIALEETATPGKNNIYGTSAAETFDPKGYARYLQGNGGADTYIYNSGYGAVEINADGGYGVNSTATLQFGSGMSAAQLVASSDGGGNITLTDGVTGDSLKLDGEMGGGWAGATAEYGVTSVAFSDGTSMTRQQLIALEETGAPGKMRLYGTSGADTFDPKGYSSYAQGAGGADAFIYNSGYGAFEINENNNSSATTAILALGTSLNAADLSVAKDASGNVILTDGVTNDKVTLDGQLNSTAYGVTAIKTADGVSLTAHELAFGNNLTDENLWFAQNGNDLIVEQIGSTREFTIQNWFAGSGYPLQDVSAGGLKIDSQIAQLVSAMATFGANNPSFNVATASQMPTDAGLQSAIAAAWHS